jgi:hypothetical protein
VLRMLRCTEGSQQIDAMGHSLPIHSVPALTFVRYAPNSDQKWCSATNDAMGHKRTRAPQQLECSFIQLSGVIELMMAPSAT